MIEAELKARVTDPEQVYQRLAARAAERRSVYHDTYFDRPDRSLTTAGLGDPVTVATILRALGLGPVIAFSKQCANFTFDADERQVLATLVRVPELSGTWLEVETLVEDQTELDKALGVVRLVLGELGIGEADLTTELYTDMVARQRDGTERRH